MPASQEQKVDFLLKKIGYSASKTGVAEDESTIGLSTNTAKKPFEEGIASPLTIPSTSILSDSSFIPTTPPGSDTLYVKGYRTATALRMTRDSTVGTNTRSYIAYTTYNDTSSARLTNWIDTQFGSSYIIKVYKGDPNSGGVELQQAGGNAGTDGWFFDYSSGILNFNGINLPDGVTATNIYIVGYRYIGATGVQPPAGIGTFHDLIVHNNLHVSGVSTFTGAIDANGNLNVAGISTFTSSIHVTGVGSSVGIGTANPTQKLEVYDGKILVRNKTDDAAKIILRDDSGSYNHYQIRNENGTFKIRNSGASPQYDAISVLSTGNIGINSTIPTARLDVNGDTKLQGNLNVTGISTFVGIITASAVGNVIPFLFNNYSDLPSASSYHGAFAHVHEYGKGYFAHAGNWMELVNKETTGIVGTGTERYDIGYLDATNLYVTGLSTIGSIGINTGIISGPTFTYIDPATVGDNTGTLVVKGNLQVEGTQTTVNSTTMNVADKNVGIASGAANDAAADGAGLTVYAGSNTDKTWQWLDATDSWTSSEHIRIPDDKVIGFTTDTDTHISRPTTDQLLLTTGGTGRARFHNNQTKIGPDADSATESTNYNFQVSSYTGPVCSIFSLKHSSNGSVNNVLKQGFIFKNAVGSALDFARIQAECTDVGNGTEKGDLVFYTTYNQTAGEKLRITGIGSVGINSTAPTALLDVKGTAKIGDYGQVEVLSNGQVQLYYQNSTRLSTNGQGGTFLGNLNFIGNGYKATFGASGELEILNLEAISLVRDIRAGVGTLAIEADNVFLRNKGGSQNYLEATDDAGVKLNFAGAQKLETTGIGISVPNINVTGITTTLQLQVGTLGHTMVGITTILDEDNMASDSATALATQQSIKAYVDNSTSSSNLAVSADSGSNESINLATEVLDIEGTANEIETVTGTNKVVIGLPNNVTIGNKLTVTGDVGIGASLNVTGITTFANTTQSTSTTTGAVQIAGGVGIQKNLNVAGVSTFQDDVTINKDKMLIFDRFGEEKTRIRWNDTLVVTQIRNTNDNLEIGYRPTHLMWLGDRVLGTKLGGVNITGDTETDTLSVGGTATFTGTISAGSTTGTDGYYLKTTGIGVTWAAFPSSRTGLTTAATAGQSSFNFSYNVGYVDVFVNGVKLPSSEFTASNGSTIILDDAAFENDTIEFVSYNTVPNSSAGAQNLDGLADVTITGTPVRGETLQHNGSVFVNDYTPFNSTTSTSETLISGVPAATYRSVEYTVQATRGTDYHVTKLLAIHDGTNVTFNEYGTLFTSVSLASFSFDISSGSIRLLATPTSSASTVFKIKFNGIKV